MLDPVNARKHDRKNIEAIKGSLTKFGQQKPIVVDAKGIILAGNGTLVAAKELGWTEIWTHRSDLEGTNATAYALADNRTAELASWDDDILNATLKSLTDMQFDIGAIGFDPFEESKPGNTEDDEVPEVPQNVHGVSLGDIWQLGEHRLMCGDSLNKESVNKLMGDVIAEMCFTDPPYNVNYGNIKYKGRYKTKTIENDNMPIDEFKVFCETFAERIKERTRGCIYCFAGSGADGRVMFTAMDQVFHCSTMIIWNKDRLVLGMGKYQNKYEPCWFGWNVDGKSFIDNRSLTNVWDIKRPSTNELHPTMKPIELIIEALGHASKPNDKILDLFLGSGSTLIACEKTNRKCYGMEIDPHYCSVIIERWQKYTGKQACLTGS